MNIAVPKESAESERRVALVPETVGRLVKSGLSVAVEHDAGIAAGFPDAAYAEAGATIVADGRALLENADLVAMVRRPSETQIGAMRPGAVLITLLAPLGEPRYVERLAQTKLTTLSMDAIPRITRAQSMDVLSSQANIAGYKAALLAAEYLPKFFPMLTTAAGTIAPAKVLVIGAGVAGLQAIATARRLGAVVTGYDTRAAVKEQVQSLGANFLEFDLGADAEGTGGYAKELTAEQLAKQQAGMKKAISESDAVITTAAVPGRRAPVIITKDASESMRPGSVIVDIAAETGGNAELTEPGKVVTTPAGVTIVGLLNLPSTMPSDASRLYSRNVFTLLQLLVKDGALNLDFEDEIVKGTTLTHEGKIVHEPTLAALATTGGPA
ncbi:MAG TPA: Re/Si-specific NAD(P)(+) transhydrogenase subunit alpha [Candidatus Acidoferrales bacterium]|nr:Re/Si-specific NAD(P)(+) transhydrogenase subunit alpha [Candidatus Acidoferrales bacterium]